MLRLGIVSVSLLMIALAPFALADAPDPVVAGPVMAEAHVRDPAPASIAAADPGSAIVFDFGFEDSGTETPLSRLTTGSSMTWTWTEGIHTVTHGVANGLDVVPPAFDSGFKRASDDDPTFTVMFDTPGVYKYYCALHPSMHGAVVVA